MSELSVRQYLHNDGSGLTLGYDKSEADKVIAEKNKEIEELQKQVHDYAQGLYVIQARAEKEIRHQKYKRCLAMADKCAEAYKRECGLNPEEMTDKEFYKQQIEFWPRWNSKWLKIGEKFKDGV